jgi:hypothetical protein
MQMLELSDSISNRFAVDSAEVIATTNVRFMLGIGAFMLLLLQIQLLLLLNLAASGTTTTATKFILDGFHR